MKCESTLQAPSRNLPRRRGREGGQAQAPPQSRDVRKSCCLCLLFGRAARTLPVGSANTGQQEAQGGWVAARGRDSLVDFVKSVLQRQGQDAHGTRHCATASKQGAEGYATSANALSQNKQHEQAQGKPGASRKQVNLLIYECTPELLCLQAGTDRSKSNIDSSSHSDRDSDRNAFVAAHRCSGPQPSPRRRRRWRGRSQTLAPASSWCSPPPYASPLPPPCHRHTTSTPRSTSGAHQETLGAKGAHPMSSGPAA